MKYHETSTHGVKVIVFSDVQREEVRWLWHPYIARGKITILQGDPGEGKTTLALHLAAAVTRGELPDGTKLEKPYNVLYQTAEDGIADTVVPRLLAAGADMSRIGSIMEETEPLDLIDTRLEQAMEELHPALVILDPLQAFLGADVNMHRANEIRPVMTILAQMAMRHQTAIVLIGHMNKQMGSKSLYRGLGSIDLTASSRSVLLMARDPKEQDVRVLMHIKSSLAKEGDPLAFRIGENSTLTYQGVYEGNTSVLLSADTGIARKKRIEEAELFLKEEIASGELRSAVILEHAKERGLSASLLTRAKKKLGITSYKTQNGWMLRHPVPLPQDQNLITEDKCKVVEDDYLDPEEWQLILP